MLAAETAPGAGTPAAPRGDGFLIREMAADNPLWGVERIRGELGKLGIRVAKHTIQTYVRGTCDPRPRGQT